MNTGPLSGSLSFPPVWQPGGVGGGGLVTVREKVPVAVLPAASVTVTVKVEVPIADGAPSSSPDGRSDSPAGGRPDQVYGSLPPLAWCYAWRRSKRCVGCRLVQDDREAEHHEQGCVHQRHSLAAR